MKDGIDNATILLAEDSPLVRQMIERILQRSCNYNVQVAQNGQECLDIVQDVNPDLILLDIMMPLKNGFETCEALKADPVTSDIPVIFLSALGESADKVKGLEVGAVDYITKPVQKAELIARVNTHLKNSWLQRELKSARDEYQTLVHVLCHDMGNYLNHVYAYSDMGRDLKAEQFDTLSVYNGRIYQSAERATGFLQNVREFVAAKDRGGHFRLKPHLLQSMVEECVSVFESRIAKKSIHLHVDVPDGLMLKVDRSWFVTSVLNNLMSNAIKFCYENGNISIKAEYGESGVKVVFSDDGTGVPEYVAEKMFTNKSVSTSGTSGERGTGFGMPLVKRWVEVFNGTIVLETRPEEDYPEEHGTSFILNFPLCES